VMLDAVRMAQSWFACAPNALNLQAHLPEETYLADETHPPHLPTRPTPPTCPTPAYPSGLPISHHER
jgi:hypothetical protein